MTDEKAGTYEVLRMVMRGKRTFTDFLKEVPRRTLALRLKELEELHYIKREILDTRPPRPEYEILDKGKTAFRKMSLDRFGYHAEDAFFVAPTEAVRIVEPYWRGLGYKIEQLGGPAQPKGGIVRHEISPALSSLPQAPIATEAGARLAGLPYRVSKAGRRSEKRKKRS